MSTNVETAEVKPYNYELWIPPLDVAACKLLMAADLRRALAPYIGKPTADVAERNAIIQTASAVMVKWEERFDMLMDMSVTSAEEVESLMFGGTELGFEFEFPASVSDEEE